MSYLHNMLSSPNKFASAAGAQPSSNAQASAGGDDWQPYGSHSTAGGAAPVRTAAATPAPKPKVQVVTPVDELEAPAVAPATPQAKIASAAPVASAQPKPVAGAPAPITPNVAAQGMLRSNLD